MPREVVAGIVALLAMGSAANIPSPGSTVITSSAQENETMTLDCKDAKLAVSKILFASYGTPTGQGLDAATSSCNANTSTSVIGALCLKQPSCTVLAVNSVFTDPCVGIGKRLLVTAECTAAVQTLVQGAGTTLATGLGQAFENSSLQLMCQAPQVMTKILFASYGTPTNVGLYAATGSCNSTHSRQVVEAACLNAQACIVNANSSLFGDPCPGVVKRLTVTAECDDLTTTSKSGTRTHCGQCQSMLTEDVDLDVVVAVVCAIAIAVGVIVVCIVAMRRKAPIARPSNLTFNLPRTNHTFSLPSSKRKADQDIDTLSSTDGSVLTGRTDGHGGRASRTDTEVYVPLDIQPLLHHRLMLEDLHVTSNKPLASGAYGEVWLGIYGGQQVAIKRMKNPEPALVQKFIDEIVLMSQMESDYIVKFIGASWTRPIEIECVVEYMDLGDLRSYLATTEPTEFTWDQKYVVLQSVALGLVYLHTFKTPIIHRDLKSRNILLDATKGIKLTDFGTSRTAEVGDTMTSCIGTFQWMAPEIIAGTSYSAAADIYSFGIVLSELCTHKVPYADLHHPKTGRPLQEHYILQEVCKGTLRPSFEGVDVPEWVHDVASQCLELNEGDRPSAIQLSHILSRHQCTSQIQIGEIPSQSLNDATGQPNLSEHELAPNCQ
ncbi:protein kinase [Achlya hypogyna]|uniref:Protein kinase n=1 Tax=Achlya hypogyna TaxID=1202772 RepID=A0A1V9Z352_ACHHY|nr:protein kinase [Achlya hypogyna]